MIAMDSNGGSFYLIPNVWQWGGVEGGITMTWSDIIPLQATNLCSTEGGSYS